MLLSEHVDEKILLSLKILVRNFVKVESFSSTCFVINTLLSTTTYYQHENFIIIKNFG